MSEKNNDSVENFFKKAVRENDITYREGDWVKMEKLLDEQAGAGTNTGSRPVKIVIITVAILILLSVTSYFILNQTGEKPNDAGSLAQKRIESTTPSPDMNATPVDSSQKNDVTKEQAASKNGTNAEVQSTDETSLKPIASDDISSDTNSQPERAVAESSKRTAVNPVISSTGNSPAKEIGSDEHKTAPDETRDQVSSKSKRKAQITKTGGKTALKNSTLSVANESTSERSSEALKEKDNAEQSAETLADQGSVEVSKFPLADNANAKQSKTSTEASSTAGQELQPVATTIIDEKISSSPDQSLANGTAVASADSIAAVTTADKNEIEEKSVPEGKGKDERVITPSRWNVALVGAPDFSVTTFSEMASPGPAFGFLVGYRVFSRVTISTGIIRSAKQYTGYGKDYHPPKGYWKNKTNGIVPDEIKGQCSIVEFPLMLQVDVLRRSLSRMYVSGGLSSYRMTNESYNYYFDKPNEGAASSWSSDVPSNYSFSIGHFSAAYEHTLYHGLSLGVEPYVKVPFKGIGWSKVDLFTMGVYVNLRYTFLKKNF